MTIRLNEKELRRLFKRIFRLNLWGYKMGMYAPCIDCYDVIWEYLFNDSKNFEEFNLYYIFPQLGERAISKTEIKPIFEITKKDKTFILTKIK